MRDLRRVLYVMTASLLAVTGLAVLQPRHALAATQLSNRSIMMSDSSASGGAIPSGVGSGTNVTYQVKFTAFTNAHSMVIDFCSQDPIINDTCTAPTGFSAASATLTNTGAVGQVTAGNNWTITPSASQVKLADDGVAGHNIQAGSQQFELNVITNPSTVGTFYARMYTFPNNNYSNGTSTYVSATNVGTGFVDYGGIAMSTTNVITITARVQEQLTFCVTAADPVNWTTGAQPPDCTSTVVSAAPPALTLGHGSPTLVLDSNTVDLTSAYSQLSTNATHGAVIKMRNSNLTCGGLSADGGTTCAIPPLNAGAATPSAMAAGTAGFGLYVDTYTPIAAPAGGCGFTGAGGIGTIGSVAPTAVYNDGTHICSGGVSSTAEYFGMDTTTANNNTTSTYGSTVASTAAPVYRADNIYSFAATSALTTPAGIYTANLSMIATGTF